MGRKRQPLRHPTTNLSATHAATSPSASGKQSRKRLRTAGEADAAVSEGPNVKSTSDDDIDWEKVEREQEAESSDGDDESDSEDEIRLDGEIIGSTQDYSFSFQDMKAEFDDSIRTLLKKMVASPTEALHLAIAIATQEIVGTAVTCEEGDDVFAFATILPVLEHQKSGPLGATLQRLVGALRREAGNSNAAQNACSMYVFSNFESKLNFLAACVSSSTEAQPAPASSDGDVGSADRTLGLAEQTGILLHQRFLNLPLELIGHLHRSVKDDYAWAHKNQPSEVTNPFTAIQYCVIFCPCSKAGSDDNYGNSGSRSSKKGSSNSSNSNNSSTSSNTVKLSHRKTFEDIAGSTEIMFDSFEDEVYFQHASIALLWTVDNHFQQARRTNVAASNEESDHAISASGGNSAGSVSRDWRSGFYGGGANELAVLLVECSKLPAIVGAIEKLVESSKS